MRKLLPLLFLLLSAAAWAQTRIDSLPFGSMPLKDGWRFQVGDDPAWAEPRFDDGAWQRLAGAPPGGGCASACWYRLRIEFPAKQTAVHHPPLAILLVADEGVVEAYIAGRRASATQFEPWWQEREPIEYVIPLPADQEFVEFAVRIHTPRVAFDAGDAANIVAFIGSAESIQQAAALHHAKRVLRALTSICINMAIFVAGAGSLLLFISQRGNAEYLWLGIYLALVGSSFALLSASTYALVPGVTNELFADPAIYLFLVAQIEFTYAFIGHRPSRIWRAYEIVLLSCPVLAILCAVGIVHEKFYFLLESVVTLPVALALPCVLLYWHRRGNREARWLILPSLCPAAGVVFSNFNQFGDLFGWKLDFVSHPISLWNDARLFYYDVADLIFLLAVVMFFRFNRFSREQARAAAELGAAREIQQQLVPATLPQLPGCRFESAYLPASEVGGDFYQVLPQPDGSCLVVVGDVSGKGLKAAMTGALAIGALRTLAAENLSPAALLGRLNRQVTAAKNGGFITCLCASLGADGTIRIANAGHLPPYRNGQEVEVDYGLPLGILSSCEYEEATLVLSVGDRIALMTDGVLEAQSSSGELFGFDRLRSISAQTADQIAAAAESFGQQDDITVLAFTITQGAASWRPSAGTPFGLDEN
jgi:sigma-B regulation protein RsbU (phosphoserine phosphatase)